MDDTHLGRLVDPGSESGKALLGRCGVFDGFESLDLLAEQTPVLLVHQAPFLILAHSLPCRLVIRHPVYTSK